MAIFDYRGKQYSVADEYVGDFAKEYPDATTISERDGKQYRVKASDYNAFLIDTFNSTQHKTYEGLQDYQTGVVSPEEQQRRDEIAAQMEAEEKEQQRLQEEHRAAMREQLQSDGTIDRMKEAKKEPRREKLKAFGSMLGSTPQVSSYGVSSNVFDSTGEQLADVNQAMEAGTEYRQNKLLHQRLDEALDMARQGEINMEGSLGVMDGLRGMWDSASRISTWDMGYSDAMNAVTLNSLVKKWENGEELTATEQKTLDAIAMSSAVQEAYAGTTGIGYAVGQSLPQSAAFMVSMGVNPASGLGKSLARQAVRRVGRQGVKAVAARAAGRIGGDILEAGIMAGTVGLGRVTADALERINGSSDYYIDNGYIVYGGQKDNEEVNKAWWKAFGGTFIEGYTESLGNAVFDPALDAIKGLVKGGVKKGSLNAVGNAVLDVEPSRLAETMRFIKRSAKVDSMVGELLEEEVGMMLNFWDYTFDPNNEDKEYIFDLENQLTTLLSTCIMTGAISAAEATGDLKVRRRINRDANQAEMAARAVFGNQWDAIREQIDNSEPQEAADILRDFMLDPTRDKSEKSALLHYASKRITAQYYNAEEAKVRRQLLKEKQTVLDAYEAGYDARLPEFYDMRREVEESRDYLDGYAQRMGITDEVNIAIRELQSSDKSEDEILANFTEGEREAIMDYFLKSERMRGAYEGRSDKFEDYVDEFAYGIEPFVVTDAEGNRTITTGMVSIGGEQVPCYIVADDGEYVTFMTDDYQKGMRKKMDITSMMTRNADEVIEAYRQQTEERMEEETEMAVDHHPKTQQPQVDLTISRNGEEMVVTNVSDSEVEIVPAVYVDGQVQPKSGAAPQTITIDDALQLQDQHYEEEEQRKNFAKGTKQTFYVNGEEVGATINDVTPDGYIVELERDVDGLNRVGQYTLNEMTNLTTPTIGGNMLANEAQNEGTPTEEIEQSVSEEVTNGQNAPTADVSESVKPTTIEDTVAELMNQGLEDSEVDDYVSINQQKAIDNAGNVLKRKPTMQQAEGNIETFKALKEQWQAEYDKAQADALYWNNIGKEVERQRSVRTSEQEALVQPEAMDMTPQPAKRAKKAQREPISFDGLSETSMEIANDIMADMTPQNGVELAAAMLSGTGARRGFKLIPESFRRHTGYSTTEQRKFVGLTAGADKGGVTVERMGELVMQADREDGTNFFDQNDANAGMNAVLEVLGQAETIGDINQFIRRNREEVAYREAWANENAEREAEQEAKDAWYMDNYHATEEELAEYNEWLNEIKEENLPTEEDIQEVYSIFAEQQLKEYDNEGTDANLLRAADSREGQETATDGVYAVGTTEQSDEVGETESTPNGRTAERDAQDDEDVREESDVEAEEKNVNPDIDYEDRSEKQAEPFGGLLRGTTITDTIEEVQGILRRAGREEHTQEVKQALETIYHGETDARSRQIAVNAQQMELLGVVRRLSDQEYSAIKDHILRSNDNAAEIDSFNDFFRRYERSAEKSKITNVLSGYRLGRNLPLSKVDELFERYNGDSDVAALYERLRPLVETIGATIVFEPIKSGAIGGYSLQYNRISLNHDILTSNLFSTQDKAGVIVHEMLHAVTKYAVRTKELINQGRETEVKLPDNVLNAAQELIDLYEKIKDNEIFNNRKTSSGRDYGVKNVYEMIAELSTPEFREKLDRVQIGNHSALNWIKRILMKFIPKWRSSSAFERATKALDTLIDNFNLDAYKQASQIEEYWNVNNKIVTDKATIEALDASPKRIGYRNVVLNEDGTFSSPMAYWLQHIKGGAKTRIETDKFELDQWEEAQESIDLVDENGQIALVKPDKGTVKVAYDPYIHNRLEPVNLQFKDAWKRDDLVYVETEVAETDLNSGYHAEKAKLPVGVHSWSNGAVMLSQYDKPVRILPWDEVADAWAERLNGEGVNFDRVPAAMREHLVERGVEILPPTKGMGKDCNDAYKAWKKENAARQAATDAALQALNNAGVKVHRATRAEAEAVIGGQFLKDSNGTVYGWTVNGEIYLTEQGLNPETPIHEYTHLWATAMMHSNPKQWENIKEMLKGTPVWDEVLNDEAYENTRDNEDEVASEALSRISGKNGAQKMVEMAEKMMAEAKGDVYKMADAQSLINRMRNALRELWQWVADALGIDYKSVEEVSDKILEDLMSGVNPVERLRENVGNVDALKGDVQFAVQHVLKGNQREQAIKDLMKVTGRSRRTVEKWLKAEESLASVILNEDNLALLDLEADETLPSVWKNSDYPQGTVEFSNICRKRLPFTTIYQRLQREYPNTVFDAVTLNTIRETMKQNGEEVACGLCYVEDRRQLLGEIGQGFIDAVKGENTDVNSKQAKILARLKESGDKYVPNLYDILTLDGMKALRKSHPEVARAFVDYNGARGMQAGRLFMAYSAYNREILKYKKDKVKSINDNGGLRVFSFSDFEAHHLIDLVQVISDCAAKGIKIQGYTKVPEFAKAVKDTGAKINRSLIAKGKGYVDADYVPQKGEAVSPNVINGKRLLFDTVEGIDVNDPNFFDASESKSVGNVLVATNEEHARLAMLDPFVDYIIGFHSGQSKQQLEGKGIADWHNYKNEQLEKVEVVDEKGRVKQKNAEEGINIYTDVLNPAEAEGKPIKTKKQFVERFLKACEERGFVPRFANYLDKKNGKYVYTEGYHKFLIDFKLFDERGRILPQEAVLPIFDNEFNKQILEDYVKDTKEQLPNDDVYNAVKDALTKDGILRREGEGAVSDREVSYENDPIAKFMGKPRYYGKKASAYAERERGRMKKAISETANKLGLQINVIDDVNDVPVERRRAKGWYNTRTGEIVVIIPNHVSAWDAVQTVLHEGIAHYGLRNLFGEEFDVVLDNIYNNVAHELKAKIDAIAAERGLDTRIATEEYLASLAEDTNFEEAQKMGWWAKIKSWFAKMFEALTDKEASFFEQLTDNELRYILWSSYRRMTQRTQTPMQVLEDAQMQMDLKVGNYAPSTMVAEPNSEYTSEEQEIIAKAKADGTYMKAPNGKPTNLTEKQWAQVRTKAFKKWFGDWINEPENASKIVDENGEPRVVNKRMAEKRNVFNTEFGQFFSSEPIEDLSFGEYVGEYFLNIKNPLVLDAQGEVWSYPMWRMLANEDEVMPSTNEEYERVLNERNLLALAPREIWDIVRDDPAELDFEDAYHIVKNYGLNYDGVIIHNIAEGSEADQIMDDYIASKPTQIKSATENNGEYSDENDDIRYREAEPFYSNAERAVETIKQQKATPEQWLAMIKKDGGLKAGEDKWMGLSDWLNEKKEAGVKSLTKDRVLSFIESNEIQIEEVEYEEGVEDAISDAEDTIRESLQELFDMKVDELRNENPEQIYMSEIYDEAYSRMCAELGYREDDAPFMNADATVTLIYDANSTTDDLIDLSKRLGFSYDNSLNIPKAEQINSTRLDYTTEGLDNKKEIALVVPTIEPWNRSDTVHFGDAGEGRAVAWVRFGETTDADGKRVLVIDEVQSKRHDEGRSKGYSDLRDYDKKMAALEEEAAELLARRNKLIKVLNEKYGGFTKYLKHSFVGQRTSLVPNPSVMTAEEIKEWNETSQDSIREREDELKKLKRGVPDAPFDKNYHELVMKRMLRYAAENGYDKVAWTKGAQQAERYNLGGVVDKMTSQDYGVDDNGDTIRLIQIRLKGENNDLHLEVNKDGIIQTGGQEYEGKHLGEVVGKEAAVTLMTKDTTISGGGLRVGDGGRNALYDEMIPRFMNKYVKKWGAKVGEVTLPNVEAAGRTMWSVDVTPEMKESVMQGQPMFRTAEVVDEGPFSTEEKTQAIVDEAASLGVKVRVAHNTDELHPKAKADIENGKPVKGYYDTRTGEVVIYAPYATSENDVKRTILHEVVGHKGLRKLLGEDNFNKMMVQMYQMLPEEERRKVWNAAMNRYGDISEAMEEYLAEKAENLEKPKWWQKILTAAKMWLGRKFGLNLTDADINYLLWRGSKSLAGDTATDMAISAMLKQAAKQSDLTEEEIKELKEAEMRLFEKGQRFRDIRGRTGDATREYESAVNTSQYRTSEAFHDSMLGLKTLQEAIVKESGKDLMDWENPYMAQNRMSSINLRDMEMYKKNEYNKLLKAVSDLMELGASYEEITDYMMAKHGLERNEKFARRDAVRDADGDPTKEQQLYDDNRKTDYSGLTALTGESKVEDAENAARQMVDAFEQKYGGYPVNELWRRTKSCNQKTLEIAYDGGIMSKETYDELSNQFDYYIPLRGFDETTAEDVYFYVGGKESPYNAPIKTAKGRKSKADDPIATIGSVAESAITDANRNRVKMEFYNMVLNHKTDLVSVSDIWMAYDAATDSWVAQFPSIPNDATPAEVKAEMEAFEARMQANAAANPNMFAKASEKPNIPYRVVKKADENEHQVIVKKNGRDVVMTVNGNPRAAQAVNGLTNPEARDEWYNRLASWVNRNLSANFTTRNPAFVISNFVRDGIYTNSMVWVKETPAYAWKYNQNWKKVTANITSLVKKYKKYEDGDKSALDMNDPMQKMFFEFMTNGGETGYTAMHSVDDYKRMSKKELKKMLRKGALSSAEKVIDFLAEGLDTFGRWAEDTSRFAAYVTSREMGRSVARSIYDAKEISVNFNKKGAGSKMRGKFKDDPMAWLASTVSQGGRNLYVFWNAGVQGLMNFKNAAADNKSKFAVMAMAAMAAGVLIPVIFSSDDDDDDEYYLLPEYVRRNNICIKVGKKQFITLPLPIEIRALYGMGELAYSYLSGKEELSGTELTTKIIQQMSQVFPIDMMADGGGAMALVPSSVKPIVEAAVNVDWTGDPIYKEKTSFNENYPAWMLSYKSTSPELVWLSRKINEATNENTPSGEERMYNVGRADNRFFNNPAVWEHIWEGYLGGIGTITNQTKKTLMMPFDKDLQEVRNVPVVSRFVKTAGDRAKEYSVRDEYYDALDYVDKLSDEVSAYRREVYDVTKTDEQREGMIGVYKEMAEHATKTIKTNDKLKEVVSNLEKQRKINPEAKVNIDGNDLPIGEAIEVMRQKAIDNAKEFMERE